MFKTPFAEYGFADSNNTLVDEGDGMLGGTDTGGGKSDVKVELFGWIEEPKSVRIFVGTGAWMNSELIEEFFWIEEMSLGLFALEKFDKEVDWSKYEFMTVLWQELLLGNELNKLEIDDWIWFCWTSVEGLRLWMGLK